MSIQTIRTAICHILAIILTTGWSLAYADEYASSTNALYAEIQRTVAEADFQAMANTYHPDAVVVTSELTHPVADVIERWKSEGEAFKQSGGAASVDFRFSSRLIGEKSAFDMGIFRYTTVNKEGVSDVYYTHFENLAILKDGKWQTIMEHQPRKATEAEWNELPDWAYGKEKHVDSN